MRTQEAGVNYRAVARVGPLVFSDAYARIPENGPWTVSVKAKDNSRILGPKGTFTFRGLNLTYEYSMGGRSSPDVEYQLSPINLWEWCESFFTAGPLDPVGLVALALPGVRVAFGPELQSQVIKNYVGLRKRRVQVIEEIARLLKTSWYTAADGTVVFGQVEPPAFSGKYDLLSQNPRLGLFELYTETSLILPRQYIEGVGVVQCAEYILHGKRDYVRVKAYG